VLTALAGRSFASQVRQAAAAPLTGGIDVPSDTTAGRAIGERVATLVLRRLRRYR
jgi:hypothetical protein